MAAFPWPRSHATEMFVVSEAEITAIRTAFDQGGEFAAAVQLRRLFPGVTDNVGHSRRTTWGHTVAARGQQMFCQPAAAKTLVSVCVRKDWVLQSCAHLTMHGKSRVHTNMTRQPGSIGLWASSKLAFH